MNSRNPMNPRNPVILLTFDVEDWFQVENFKQTIPFASWSRCDLRIEKNVHKILDLLDSINRNTAAPQHRTASPSPCAMRSALCESPKATFFVLGWIAERLPHLIRQIHERGHEIASHGYAHELCHKQSVNELRVDLVRSKELLEDITGFPVYGYRAPSFSISDNALSLIEWAGYLYDSSFNSFTLNKRYGKIHLNGNGGNGILNRISTSFYEFPISNVKIRGKVLPWGGGGYFRLIPSKIFQQGVLSILKKHGAYLFYMHPWEIDPDQPRVSNVPISFKFRHYMNLGKTYSKLSYFFHSFNNCRFLTCSQYIAQNTQATQ